MHRLLKRQLKKANLSDEQRSSLKGFLEQINAAYESSDNDIRRVENILEKSSRELFVANEMLQKDIATKSEEVTETKMQLERVVNNVRGVIFETDAKGNYIFLNPAWEELTGYTVKESIGRHYSDFMESFDIQSKGEMNDAIFSGLQKYSNVVPSFAKDGSKKWIEVTFKWIKNDQGQTTGVIGSFIDVTALKETELKLKKSQALQHKANMAKDDFLSIMSHEIRTPLNGVIGITNILLMEDHLQSQEENLQGLKYSSEHLLALINDILDYNKIEAGKIDFEQKEFDLNALLAAIKQNFEFQAIEKGIKFKIKREDTVPNVLIGDSTRLSQVLNNLISNAVKFTAEGQVVLDIEVNSDDQEIIDIKFEIKDSGIGIAPENLENIFDKFKQAESSTTRKFGGTGLGLSICKKLLLLQDSDLHVQSEINKGSTFQFTLKFKKSNRFEIKSSNYISVQPSFSNLDNVRVLVAEDNKLNIHVIKRFLTKWNADFDIAENGQDAVELYLKKEYDIVLMDLQMPIMNGYEASKLIKAQARLDKKVIPIIALTASAQMDIKFKTEEIGMNGFVSKPFNPVQLYNTIKEQLAEVATA